LGSAESPRDANGQIVLAAEAFECRQVHKEHTAGLEDLEEAPERRGRINSLVAEDVEADKGVRGLGAQRDISRGSLDQVAHPPGSAMREGLGLEIKPHIADPGQCRPYGPEGPTSAAANVHDQRLHGNREMTS
jgi:hypothetical protein